MTAIRQRLRDYIDIMPEHRLAVVEPILATFADEADDFIIETNLTPEEIAICEAGRKEREEHPESFTDWEIVKARSRNYTIYKNLNDVPSEAREKAVHDLFEDCKDCSRKEQETGIGCSDCEIKHLKEQDEYLCMKFKSKSI